jgi:hypothetical protein
MPDMDAAAQATTRQARLGIVLLLAGLLLAGVVVSVLVAWAIAYARTQPTRTIVSYSAVEGDESRAVSFAGNRLMRRATVSRAAILNWGPQRAAGPPDTHQMGDIPTAWASDTPDGQPEWLELDYAQPIAPRELRVYETNAPGALSRVTFFDSSGNEIEIWSGADPARPDRNGISVASIPVTIPRTTSRIRLYLDSPRVQGWNEIDAVGLVDSNDQVHWARHGRASTTYAVRGTPPMSFAQMEELLPGWIRQKPAAGGNAIYEAYGWPMLAMSMETTPGVSPVALPMRPVWRGLLGNGIIYGSLLGLGYLLSFRLRRFVRESIWLRKGRCMHCGYDLRFDLVRGCPECGWRRQG